jgi:hypothetical protein
MGKAGSGMVFDTFFGGIRLVYAWLLSINWWQHECRGIAESLLSVLSSLLSYIVPEIAMPSCVGLHGVHHSAMSKGDIDFMFPLRCFFGVGCTRQDTFAESPENHFG